MGTAFYQEGLSLNIAGDESLRFEENFLTQDEPRFGSPSAQEDAKGSVIRVYESSAAYLALAY